VIDVLSGEAAQAAGLTAGDLITSFGGSAVDSPTTLVTLVDRDHPGQSAAVGWTDQFGQSHDATVTLGTGPAG
jgi:S1-C subfamily serine protease